MTKFATPDGWSVEVVDLELTRPPNTVNDPVGDGEQFLVRHGRHAIAFVRTIPELARYVRLSELEEVR
jgi:hypothetical protein